MQLKVNESSFSAFQHHLRQGWKLCEELTEELKEKAPLFEQKKVHVQRYEVYV